MDDLVFESNSYLSRLDDIELEYNIFLAENEMNKKILQLGSDIVHENDISLYAVTESVKDWIIKYATKISEALQKAWEKLKIIFSEGKDYAYLKSIQNKVETMTESPNFNINNVRIYDNQKFSNFKIKAFDYATMKDSLGSEKQFLAANYSDLGFDQNNTNIKEVCNNYFVSINSNPIACTVDYIKQIFNWSYKDYINQISSLENMMKAYNTSTKNIETLANTVANQPEINQQPAAQQNTETNTTSNITPVQAACIMYESCILEAENNNMSFQDTGANPNADKSGASTGNNISDATKVFLTATTGILSALFIIVKNQKADYIRILKHCFPPMIGKKKDDSDIISDNNEEQTGSIPQVG